MRTIIKRRSSKKGQAAMEFLMTYGWAILAAIVAIGVLAYFGVFSTNLRGSNAILNNPYFAAAWNADDTAVRIDLVNNGGDTLVISDMEVTGSGTSTANCEATAGAGVGQVPITINPGEQILVPMDADVTAGSCATLLVSGGSYQGDIVITYTKSGSTLVQTSTGTISTPIQ